MEINWTARATLLIRRKLMDQQKDAEYRFDERAGIREYDGNMSREDAERLTYMELNRKDAP